VTIAWVPQRTGPRGAAPAPTTSATERAQDARGAREECAIEGPAVAFAIGRRVGPAVVRNRLRRRIRHELGTLARADRLPAGCYLVGLQPEAAPLDSAALRSHLCAALRVAPVDATVVA
jgi:ribonuclease P protein component